jgi:acyl-CoA reductase-like NAD-dependent aldehyde dehydrogenase
VEPHTLFIGGARVAADSNAAIQNPADGSLVGLMPLATMAQLDLAVVAAKDAFVSWNQLPDSDRQAACLRIAGVIAAHSEELALLVTLEQGKPLNGLGSRFELGGAQAWTRYTANLALPAEVLQDNADGRVEMHRKPLGVTGSITPWNWPVMIACWHIIPAIRTGNTVVIKPSPMTPLSTIRLVELMNDVLPPGVVNVVTGTDEIGTGLTAHSDIAKMSFTGSTSTGRKVMASAAQTLKRLTLELGGNDAAIVLPDADVKSIAEKLFWGAFINSGQTCAALKRLYVHASIHEAVCDALVAYARDVRVGDGRDEHSMLGPVQNRMQFNRVCELVDDARARGGRVLLGGEPQQGPGHFYPVTLVADVSNGVRLVDEEQFGPVLPIIRYTNIDEAISLANANPAGLGGSIWSGDPAKARHYAMQLECGSVWINKHGTIQPNAPFGGIKQSGVGIEFGVEGLKEFTAIQTVLS